MKKLICILFIIILIIIIIFHQALQNEQLHIDNTVNSTISYEIVDMHTPVEADGFIIISNEYCWYAEEILVHYKLSTGHLEYTICNFPPIETCSKYKTRVESIKARNYESVNWEWSERLLSSRVIIGKLRSNIGKNNAPVYYCTLEDK